MIVQPKSPGRAFLGARRATFHVERSTGQKWWAFAGADGRVVSVRETRALAEGLAAVRMGEYVVDDKTGRELLDRISSMENRVALARQVVKTYPLEAGRQGLPAAISEWQAEMDRNRPAIDRLKGAAQRAIIIRTWGSASDEDLAVLGRLEDGAISLEERAHTTEAAAKPAGGGVRPPIPAPVYEPTQGGISTLGWVGIGAGALAVIGLLATFFSSRGTTVLAGAPRKGRSVNTTTVMWGVKKGDPDWMETILSTQPERFEEVKAMARRDGWGRFRVATINLTEPPDFAKTVKV